MICKLGLLFTSDNVLRDRHCYFQFCMTVTEVEIFKDAVIQYFCTLCSNVPASKFVPQSLLLSSYVVRIFSASSIKP